ncbi:RsmB/NOP family class I SAM-dependent RNA methyltransferase [Altericroceibacterium spongiae]|uniref:RsmB/NOP family class I SAM-dependent RNA methyltransferase n=1 Tax=Altericroceibacterium spongiae TaxID=2320269 RepID=A0A420EF56_9SPHN|nr:RsmB/NOP family class I SAM-dependent RNA methyltransferase [Altericroceibacterium spongiae]RKF19300.1 RsmB/NOP family class I SAM-dependent RNA methyltransferase [Altericroceibacterium spongiae]
MTPAARLQTAIELLDDVIGAARTKGAPADRLLAEWFRSHRFAGSKDRRAIRELVYRAIRACGPVPASGRAAALRLAEDDPVLGQLFDGSQYGPSPVGEDERPAEGGVAPEWLVERLRASDIAGEEGQALLGRAPLDLRVNSLKADRDSIAWAFEVMPLATRHGVRVAAGTQVEQSAAFREGLIEIQDGGSQLACEAVNAAPGETIIDLCAGAGGKTLALAAAMANKGRLIAADTDRSRLSRLAPRAERAGALISETLLLDPRREMEALAALEEQADAVLIDAPCSGTGTWRRNPEARWRLDENQLSRYVETQRYLLDLAVRLVRPGGRMVYVTCSLLDEEGADQIDAFLTRHQGWDAELLSLPAGRARKRGWRLSPFHDETDGFFIARLGKR